MEDDNDNDNDRKRCIITLQNRMELKNAYEWKVQKMLKISYRNVPKNVPQKVPRNVLRNFFNVPSGATTIQSTLDFSEDLFLFFLFFKLLFGTTFIGSWTFNSWFSLSIFSYFDSFSTFFLSDCLALLIPLPLPVILCNVLFIFDGELFLLDANMYCYIIYYIIFFFVDT